MERFKGWCWWFVPIFALMFLTRSFHYCDITIEEQILATLIGAFIGAFFAWAFKYP
jgi:hypothetical protein